MKLMHLPLAIFAAAALSGCATATHGIIVPPIAPPLPTESMKSCAPLPTLAGGSINERDAWIAKVAPDYAECANWQKELAAFILRNR